VSWSRDHDFESWKKCRKKEPCISCSSQGILARIITGKYVFWINVWFFPSYVQANHLQNINYHFPIPIHPSNRPTTHPLIPIIPSSSQFICCSFLYTFRSSFSPLLGGINDVSSGDLAFVPGKLSDIGMNRRQWRRLTSGRTPSGVHSCQ